MAKRLRGNDWYKMLDRYAGIFLVWLLGIFSRRRPAPANPTSILVIKLSAIGDTILLLPSLQVLKENYPGARISFLCTRINRDIVGNCAHVDNAIEISIGDIIRSPLRMLRLLRSSKPDIAVDFDQWVRLSTLMAWFSGAPYRLGFRTAGQGRHFLYSVSIPHRRDMHEVDAFLSLLSPLGITVPQNAVPEYTVTEHAVAEAGNVLSAIGLAEHEPFIILHPETPLHGGQRQWPAANYETMGKTLARDHCIRILISGVAREEGEKSALAKAIGPAALALPSVSISVFAGILQRARLLVCGNTGVMHMACAVGTPVIGLHGPTSSAKWGPRSPSAESICSTLACSPCLYLGFEYGCASNRCMVNIPVSLVAEKAKKHCIVKE